jgi:hypothetical protein
MSLGITAAATAFVAFTDYNLLWALGAAIALGLGAHVAGVG